MLAQNFKTPADLGISDAEFDALYKVLGILEREEVQHVEVTKMLFMTKHTPNGFNMRSVNSEHECGTACCILGWARIFGGDDLFREPKKSHLADTFCMGPPINGSCRGKSSAEILPSEAAIALRNYLTHGDPRWEEAFAN